MRTESVVCGRVSVCVLKDDCAPHNGLFRECTHPHPCPWPLFTGVLPSPGIFCVSAFQEQGKYEVCSLLVPFFLCPTGASLVDPSS